ncbi:MAG: hypothetical protein K1Y36_03335 [Blastocatellia bacterium]|nr:hypothetical protein [Blastocatellia bacterium]
MKNQPVCPKCNSTQVIPEVQVFDQGQYSDTHLKVALHEKPDAWLFKGTHLGVLKAWICGTCGYTELYLANPQELYAAYQAAISKD